MTSLKEPKAVVIFDAFTVGSLLRLTLNGRVESHTLNSDNCSFGWYKRCITTYLFIVDHNRNRTFVFGHKKRKITTERELWESSDINYWGA